MKRQIGTTYGIYPINIQKVTALLKSVGFGLVTIRVVDGSIPSTPTSKIRYTRKPRSHLQEYGRDQSTKKPPSFNEAVQEFLQDIEKLKGTWEVAVRVANTVPIQWDFEEIGPLQYPNQN